MITIRVHTIGSEEESARRLRFPTFTRVDDYTNNLKNNLVIRLGNSILLYDEDKPNCKLKEFDYVINPAAAISFNCQKNLSLERLSTVVNTPKIFKRTVPEGQLAVVRPTAHSGGKGFEVLKGSLTLPYGYYATEFLKTETEFRVWFCGNATMIAQRVTQNPERMAQKYKCRSLWPYSFHNQVPKDLHQQTLTAAKAIGLECGAADILYHEGKYIFLELNSAPTIDLNRIESFYRSNIYTLIKSKYPNIKI